MDFLLIHMGNKATYNVLIENLKNFTGDTEEIIKQQVDYLIKTNQLVVESTGIRTSKIFSDMFVFKQNKINESFEELWITYGRVGNKQKAKDMYSRAIKEVTDTYLLERAKLYVIFINNKGVFQQHLSTWLNPKYKEFDNDYTIETTEESEYQESFL